MDNDELRRGKPTVWKKYGETLGVLVWDGLQTLGFECLVSSGNIEIIDAMAKTLGDFGIIRWQVRDTLLRQDTLSLGELTRLQDEKTGGFIRLSFLMWALLAGADSLQREKFAYLWQLLGRAFQIQDDILDFEGDSVSVGKKTGKDVALGKWIVALLGIEWAKTLLLQIQEEILVITREFGDEKIIEIAQFIMHRHA
jgi:farnesyl diphosphate synthase